MDSEFSPRTLWSPFQLVFAATSTKSALVKVTKGLHADKHNSLDIVFPLRPPAAWDPMFPQCLVFRAPPPIHLAAPGSRCLLLASHLLWPLAPLLCPLYPSLPSWSPPAILQLSMPVVPTTPRFESLAQVRPANILTFPPGVCPISESAKPNCSFLLLSLFLWQ